MALPGPVKIGHKKDGHIDFMFLGPPYPAAGSATGFSLVYSRWGYFYPPQCSCSKVMFLHLSVILFTGGLSAVDGMQPTGMHSCIK